MSVVNSKVVELSKSLDSSFQEVSLSKALATGQYKDCPEPAKITDKVELLKRFLGLCDYKEKEISFAKAYRDIESYCKFMQMIVEAGSGCEESEPFANFKEEKELVRFLHKASCVLCSHINETSVDYILLVDTANQAMENLGEDNSVTSLLSNLVRLYDMSLETEIECD